MTGDEESLSLPQNGKCSFLSLSDDLPELTDVIACLAVGVGAGVPVVSRGVGVYCGVGGVGVGPPSTGQGEHAAHSEARGAGSRGGSSEGATLRGRVTGSIEIISAAAS